VDKVQKIVYNILVVGIGCPPKFCSTKFRREESPNTHQKR